MNDLVKAAQSKQNTLRLRMISKGLRVDQVFGRRVLIKLVKPYTEMDSAEKTGLYIPEAIKEKNEPLPSTGIVIMMGNGCFGMLERLIWPLMRMYMLSAKFCEGDMIMFSKYAGTDFRVDEEDYRILDINEVICRLVAVDGETTTLDAN